MRRKTWPPVMLSMNDATPSHMVLTRLAPMASRVSTSRWTTSISTVSAVAGWRMTSRSTAPPPRATILGWRLLARLMHFFLAPLEDLSRLGRVGDIHQLDLADEDRIAARGGEPAGDPCGLGGEAEGRHDGGFLHRQRHDVVLAVDQEVEPETDGQAHHADDVLDHGVGVVDVEDGVPVDQGLVLL